MDKNRQVLLQLRHLADFRLLMVTFAVLVVLIVQFILTLHVYQLILILFGSYCAHNYKSRNNNVLENIYDGSKPMNVCIVGSGFSGICMAHHLKKANIPFVMFEKSSDVGGTWWDNKYPGCACDVWTPLYQFSFFRNPNWSQFVCSANFNTLSVQT